MTASRDATDHFVWLFTLCIAVCGALALVPLTFASLDGSAIFYVVVTVPVVSLILLLLAFKRRRGQRRIALIAWALFVILTIVIFTHFLDTRDAVRWLAYGRSFKAKTLAQTNPGPSDLKHTEWEGWGFPGAGDTVVYLVFDPTDSLAAAAKSGASGEFGDLPCAVVRVRRREKGWYTVLFYTDTDWDHCAS
jgi:hypothetical protein